MGVLAYKIVGADQVQRDWECGTFDLMVDSDPSHGWVVIARDCDSWPARRTLTPYASGMKTGGKTSIATNLNPSTPYRKFFSNTDDTILTTLDFSDINGGVLPPNPCNQMFLFQDGVKMPCSAYTIDYLTSVITIDTAWQTPGAAYEAVYFAPTVGGGGS